MSTATLRLLTPSNATWAVPTHPETEPEVILSGFGRFFDVRCPSTYVIATPSANDLDVMVPDGGAQTIVNLHRVNDVLRINKFFEGANAKLPMGGRFVVCVETFAQRRERILAKYHPVISYPYYAASFMLQRVCPKLRLTRGLYFRITKGRNRAMSHVETLGRLYCCGFKVEETAEIDHLLFIVATKVKEPACDPNPSYGPLFRMRRLGKNGKPIGVYKLRTMHPFAEYLQEYVHERYALAESGKFRDDPRIPRWGRIFRRFWIDELPMLLNLLKGDLKVVGVRPLSAHYESLYPQALRDQRRRHTPGLVPPFYADLPKTFDEIVASEARYLEAHERHPIVTDIRYFARAFVNIVFRSARSA